MQVPILTIPTPMVMVPQTQKMTFRLILMKITITMVMALGIMPIQTMITMGFLIPMKLSMEPTP